MPARDTILTAAEAVIRHKGIARATTKEIARAAGYSEAMLYKNFGDKQEIFMAVLRERVTTLAGPVEPGTGELRANLIDLVTGLVAFFATSFPMSASLFSDTELLDAWRIGMREKGGGPGVPRQMVESYLTGEQKLGRIAAGIDVGAVAALLCGAAFQHGVVAAVAGSDATDDAADLAARVVDAVGLSPHS